MLRNYWKTALRNFTKNRVHSMLNMVGLSAGMAVAMLIGLWIHEELAYNKNFPHYKRLAQVLQNQTFNGVVGTQTAVPYLMGDELKKDYGEDFKYVSMASWTSGHILAYNDKAINQSGNFMEPCITEMLSLHMLEGSRNALKDPHSVILSASTGKALFGKADPMNQLIKIDNRFIVKVEGIYQDLPFSCDFKNLTFIAPWRLFIDSAYWKEKATNPWRNNSFQTYVQLAAHTHLEDVSAKIKDSKLRNVTPADAAFKPVIFLLPMRKWHLYSQFKNGVNVGGRIDSVWLFGTIGFFVLLLACINFMNLSTARSEKRAREVGIRKAIGSVRMQLMRLFFMESLMMTAFAFLVSLLWVLWMLPYFNQVAGKEISLPIGSPIFWILGVSITLVTGLISGSYPAFYLSSFNPSQVLKGPFRAGRFAGLPRKVLVVMQFVVSVVLVIGTIVVFRQIQYAKNRPVGYNRDGLVSVYLVTEKIHDHFEAVKNELIASGAINDMAESSSPLYWVNETDNGFDWEGMNPAQQGDFNVVYVSADFGKTVGWHIKEGRDFSKDFPTDSSGMIFNEAAIQFMGIKNPIGKIIRWDSLKYHVVGVVKDIVMQSPYQPVYRTVFVTNHDPQPVVDLRINPDEDMHTALGKIEAVFRKFNPDQPFDYHFSSQEYARKFGEEQRTGKLASFFTILAILISCLGLFGMASFMAEQRSKEIAVRKVLGASVLGLWQLLTKDFLVLVLIALVIATPIAYYLMHQWLQNYSYHEPMSWWILTVVAGLMVAITIITVSYQAIRAAIASPADGLRME